MIALSYSRMENMQCPYRFYRLYIKKDFQEPMNAAAALGNKVHALTAAYREHCISNGIKKDMDWFDKMEEDTDPKEWPREMIEKFKNSIFSTIPPKVQWFCCEKTFKYDEDLNVLPDTVPYSKIAFRLIPDFAFVRNHKLYIEDDKTGKWDPGKGQSKIYPGLLLKALPPELEITEVAFRYNMILTNTPIVYGPTEVKVAKREVAWVKKQIKAANEWTVFPKQFCKVCTFCKICEIENKEQK